MRIDIFDVELGGCILVTADTGARMLIDCGHNGSTGWRPSYHLLNLGITSIDMLIVSNYDNDHVSDLPNILQHINIRSLLRNKSVSPDDLLRLKSKKGVGNGIAALVDMMKRYTGGSLSVDWGDMRWRSFYNQYPSDFEDENNLSVATFIHHGNLHCLFPGDLEKNAWERLLERDDFKRELETVNVFMASHHGRENGICEDVFSYRLCQPEVILISDASIRHNTQYTASWYATKAGGIDLNGQTRRVITTRNDGKITIDSSDYGIRLYTAR